MTTTTEMNGYFIFVKPVLTKGHAQTHKYQDLDHDQTSQKQDQDQDLQKVVGNHSWMALKLTAHLEDNVSAKQVFKPSSLKNLFHDFHVQLNII